MDKDIILAKARICLVYITSEHIFNDIENCDEKFELEDFIEFYEIVREWNMLMQLKIHGYEIDRQTFPDKEDDLQPKLEKAVNAFCFMGDDCIFRLGELMSKDEDYLASSLFAWMITPHQNIKNLLLISELLSVFDLKLNKECLYLRGFKPLIREAIGIFRVMCDATKDISFDES